MKKKSTKEKKYQLVFITGLILWLAIIFLFSSEQNLRSSFSFTTDLILRKIAHVFEYFILTFLVYKALFIFKNNSLRTIFFLASSYALLDEWHQSFVIGREGTMRDVAFDLIGILLGLYFIKQLKKSKAKVDKLKTEKSGKKLKKNIK